MYNINSLLLTLFSKYYLMKKLAVFLALVLFTGCSHSVQLNKQQTTVTYNDRLPGRVGLYIPDNLRNNILDASTSGNSCEAHSFEVNLGSTLADAIQSGVETACGQV